MGLKSPQPHPDNSRLSFAESQPSICLISVPETELFPHAVFIAALFRRENLHPLSGQFPREVKADTGVNSSDQELIGRDLSNQGCAVCILRSWRPPAIILRKAK